MPKLLNTPGAIPLFIAVFLNAFIDLGHKIIVQNTVFKLYDGPTQVALTALVNALMLLPFIFLLSPAAFLSDNFRKTRVMQVAAWAGLVLTLLITLFYYLGWFWPAFTMTLLLGAQAAIYSPAKYGYLKELFGKNRLGEANGVMSATSIVAILAGIFAYSIVFELLYPAEAQTTEQVLRAIAPVGWLLVLNAAVEVAMVYRLPAQAPVARTQVFSLAGYATGRVFKDDLAPLAHSRVIRLSVLGLATFWGVGQVMLAAFPAFVKEELQVTNTIAVQGILACTGIGIGLGSYVAGRVSRNYIETGLLPLGALGIALGLLVLTHLHSMTGFALVFLVVGFCGGVFTVPLNALVQFNAEENALGRTLAANNWVQNVVMLAFLGVTLAFSLAQLPSKTLLQMIALVALVGCFYTVYQLPQSMMRFVVSYLLSRRYRVRVQGIKNIPATGGVLMLGNHVSWIDWAILQMASPRPVRFVMLRSIYERWFLKWFFDLFGCIPIESGARSRKAIETVAECLSRGEVVCLFPEGAISRTGHLGEFRKGYERACDMVGDDVVIVPFYLRGLWGSQFSRSSRRLKSDSSQGLMRDLIVAFGQPLAKNTPRDVLKRRVLDLSIRSWQDYVDELGTLSTSLVSSLKKVGHRTAIFDTLGAQLSGYKTLTAAVTLARRMAAHPAQQVGILLPTSAAGVICNIAALLAGKTLVNLNYTASQEAFISALQQADIKQVYTAQRFLTKLQAKGIATDSLLAGVERIEMEQLGASISGREKLLTLALSIILPAAVLQRLWVKTTSADAPAVILFSSGSEGTPKGVQISHKNILANVKQVVDVLNTQDEDVVMANLPLFHAFGLTVTQFMPLLQGLPMVCHADPTDALGGAKAIASFRATILFGTSTFLRLYVRNHKIHPLMLESLRIVVAGAEKLHADVRQGFNQKFNKPIYEGYGATETTPVACVNLPDKIETQSWHIQLGHRLGSVGMPLPGSSCMVVDPTTFEELPSGQAGMILIGGPQVMLGYLNQPEKTAQAIRVIDGMRWYVTGDKGYIDEDGFLFIVDRYSRFAKIGGEMVSLSQVENAIKAQLPSSDSDLLVVALADDKKGEKLVVLHEGTLETERLRQQLLQNGLSALAIPSLWFAVEQLPKLGSGKTDFAQAKLLAERLVAGGAPVAQDPTASEQDAEAGA
jgi:acyl-[acyl-carrier-protein]-phospholipid O-acyltransferase / long-chain-fatty-acid--[acyl-carrier-protein] ligase